MKKYQLIVIGGGPAGLAAALSAKKSGVDSILILERASVLGGVLHQCIHTGFGLHYFREELTGPEYAHRFVKQVIENGIEYHTDTMVLRIGKNKTVTATNQRDGMMLFNAGSVVLATGCRERPMGTLPIAGTRPAGIMTAGAAQRLVNLNGYHIGDVIVILGSGDIGMIMARRFTLEGKRVLAVVERMPHATGLLRNRIQCLEDFSIPLLLSHTVTDVIGKTRVEEVRVCALGGDFTPVDGSGRSIACDTLVTSVGLIPEFELGRGLGLKTTRETGSAEINDCGQTALGWFFVCGNVAYVHDLVDDVSVESAKTGEAAADFLLGRKPGAQKVLDLKTAFIPKTADEIKAKANMIVCTACPKCCAITVDGDSFEGYACDKGLEYAINEVSSPARTITTTLPVSNLHNHRLPVRTSSPVPKTKIYEVMEAAKKLNVTAPIKCGETLLRRVAGCEADIIATAEARLPSATQG